MREFPVAGVCPPLAGCHEFLFAPARFELEKNLPTAVCAAIHGIAFNVPDIERADKADSRSVGII